MIGTRLEMSYDGGKCNRYLRVATPLLLEMVRFLEWPARTSDGKLWSHPLSVFVVKGWLAPVEWTKAGMRLRSWKVFISTNLVAK